MAYTLWSQDIFTKGELSPFMYGRCTVNEYQNGLKTAQNVLTYPTGAAGKRFGTLYKATLTRLTNFNQLFFQTFQYLNECVYQLVITPGYIDIYLEGILVAEVANTLNQNQVYNGISTVLNNAFRFTGVGFKPYDLTRTANSGIAITSHTSTTFTLTSPGFTANTVYPIQFTVAGGTILQTNPQIVLGVTYFAAATSTTTAALFLTSQEAAAYLQNTSITTNAFQITGSGTGTTTAHVLNTWTFANTSFINVPAFDFNGATTSYDSIVFTPSAATGSAVTITLSSAYAPLDSSYVGGAFIAGGGTARITAVADTSHFTVAVQTPFDSGFAGGYSGSLVFLAEPAWSDTRGWPQVCSSYQNRALFANTSSLPNGIWASVVNDYANFGDLTNDNDDAISWYPTSDNMNYIRFIVPYRSITVHTNTGIYSSPLSDVVAITPSNFTLQLQDSTPADVLQPQAVDNQILVLSGNDAHQMLWDGINNAYTSDIVSVINSQTINSPVDETAFVDLSRAGSRFVFIVNADGSLAVFQTLISQSVSGFTPQIMEQSYGNASFIQAASSSDSRCWFVCQRQIASAGSPIAISGFTPYVPGPPIVLSTLKATASNFSTTVPTAIKFTTTGTLPASTPAINTSTYYWAIGTDADHFEVFLTQADAIAGVNSVRFTSAGTNSNVVPWPLSTIFTLEQLTFNTFLDCATFYSGSPTNTISTGALYNAQNVAMVGDGYGFTSAGEVNVSNQIVFKAHGSTVNVSTAYIGFPINTIIEPMPLSLAMGSSGKTTILTKPVHVRFVNFMFNQTIGGTINGIPIALQPFDLVPIGAPPTPANGIFQMSIYNSWDDFNSPNFTIEHSDPFNIILLGVFYTLEV